jgi:hypothetical protein
MAEGIKETKVRLPIGLHQRLKRAAERDHRSMHQQVLSYIERGVTEDERKEQREQAR